MSVVLFMSRPVAVPFVLSLSAVVFSAEYGVHGT